MADDWTTADTVRESVFAATLAADYVQTRNILRHDAELNPILNSRVVSPEVYFSACLVLHAAVVSLLPQPYREAAQHVSIIFEGVVVGRNLALGWTFKF